ncbi:MAG: preprotein translocase subunit SecG [Coxiellaceae bacterium]|nr:preprotein translocase subunit SecG [Coxiellaceae bacterium]
MQQLILVIHVMVAIAIVALVLVQHGKGADVGAAFGAGASNTMFGSQGSTSFLMKVTGLLAAVFFATSLTLGYMNSHGVKNNKGLLDLPDSTNPVQSMPINKPVIPSSTQSVGGNADSFTPSLPASQKQKSN